MKIAVAVLVLCAGVNAFAAATVTPAAKTAAKQITPEVLMGHTRFLASDITEGRAPGSRGDRIAQQYIASEFEKLGLKPGAADGSWYQPFDIVGINGNPQKMSFVGGGKTLDLDYSKDFIAVAGAQSAESKLDGAELVFVGFGIVAPEYQWDDYKGVDLKGKVILMMNSDPEDDPALFAGKTRLWYGRWDYKYEIAAKVGAAGAIIIHTTPSAGYPWQVVQTSWFGEQFELPERGEPRTRVKGWATEDATRKIVALAGKDLDVLRVAAQKRDFKPVPLGIKVSTAFKNIVQKKKTANVIGKLPGSDPKLSKEIVLYTAHHDHLGLKEGSQPNVVVKSADGGTGATTGKSQTAGVAVNAAPAEDVIYNGAVDNASGVASMLGVARAFAALPKAPKRTVMFAAVAGEEAGLLGSQFLAEQPPTPIGNFAANINIDGLNIWGKTRDVTVIGLGKSTIDTVVSELARSQGRVVKPDQMSDRGFFYRSDQFNFAKVGVPAAYFGSGIDFLNRPEGWGRKMREEWEEKDYHQPSDQVTDQWNLEGALDDTRLYFFLGEQLAAQPRMPTWSKGDEFEDARLKALKDR